MKKIFTTIDVLAIVEELKSLVVGLRVNQIYDIDHKTYLIKLQKPDHKVVLLLESASRIHTTEYEWPKSPAPSGFSMKLRKHLRNKRLENIEQLGLDRIVDLTFGSGEACQHLIVELYDRGNIVLTDGNYTILNVLRPRKDGEETKIVVNQKYPIEGARTAREPPKYEDIVNLINDAKVNTPIRKLLNPLLDCGGALLDHELLSVGLAIGLKTGSNIEINPQKVFEAATNAQSAVTKRKPRISQRGFIIKKQVSRSKGDGSTEETFLFDEFHPRLYNQHKNVKYDELPSFNKACDEFFSNLEAHELDKKAAQKEKEAMKKLENVRKDHERRLQELKGKQEKDMQKGQLIELNQQLIEGALLVIRSALANQMDWNHIQELLDEAQSQGDTVALSIRALKLNTNMITMWLSDPYDCDENDLLLDSDEEREVGTESEKMRPTAIDIHLDESALANARRYYNMKRQAAKKEQKTIDASFKAIKSAEKKTHQTLKEVNTIANINKARKVHWFEKYLWFISSENYLAIAGRDGQQNEQVVKRHLKPNDIYVHADLHGAASVVIKNPSTTEPIPPKTLHEAGIMALCNSRAWDEKVVTSAWWVWGDQVSKTAPSGEYLTTGAFMVRGKKNFLPPSHLAYGFGFFFRLEESSIARHDKERKTVRITQPDGVNETGSDNEVDLPLADEDYEHDDAASSLVSEESEQNHPNSQIVLSKMEDMPSEAKTITSESQKEESVSALESHSNHPECESQSRTDLLESAFPDTELQFSHLKGDVFSVKMKHIPIDTHSATEIFLGDDKPILIGNRKSANKTKGQTDKIVKTETNRTEVGDEHEHSIDKEERKKVTFKRGQKGKLKKMQKYKEQDEEDRELIMQLLQSGGSKKPSKKEKKVKKSDASNRAVKRKPDVAPPTKTDEKREHFSAKENQETEILEADEEAVQVPDDLSILDALTAIPIAEDELLYAVPVCAPYLSMVNFKYKVKLTPGTGKKGKACKTAISLFLSDRSASSREKDLLKAVKDHDLAKNFPGKVKVSAPNISKVKKS